MGLAGLSRIIPQNLMVAMCLSVITAMTGDYVDVKYGLAWGSNQAKSKAGLFTSDEVEPDLSKIQMMAWTVVAVMVFLAGVIYSNCMSIRRKSLMDEYSVFKVIYF